jgi:twinkle protein
MNALDAIVERFPNRLSNIDLAPYRDDSYEPRVKSASEYRRSLKERLKSKGSWGDPTGFACDDNFRFRPHELTIWTGYKGHGKSAVLSQVLLGLLQKGKKVFICSPEFHPDELLFRFLVQCIGDQDPSEEEADVLIDFLSDVLWIYDVQASLKPHDVPALCRWVAANIKPDHIVIDSLMKCGMAPDDYAGQKRLVDQIQSIAHQNPLHMHLVAHARKGNSDEKPAKLHDIKGASEIADLAENVVSVWRNKPKEQAQSMGDRSKDSEPDAMFVVEAQRNCGGWVGTTNLWYRRDAMIYFEYGRSFRSYVSIGRQEVEL